MTATLAVGDPPIPVHIRRHAGARRLTLRVSQGSGVVSLTVPARLPVAEARAFALSREGWIRARLDEALPVVIPEIGASIPVEGQDRLLVPGKGRTAKLNGDQLEVPGQGAQVRTRARQFLRIRARDALAAACDRHAAALGRDYARLTLRDTRSRWGSCSSAGNLMFSWRLIMAPAAVLDYVAAHEVAHLRHMHHGAAFWDAVEDLLPTYRDPRRWLRANGATLHRFRFDVPRDAP